MRLSYEGKEREFRTEEMKYLTVDPKRAVIRLELETEREIVIGPFEKEQLDNVAEAIKSSSQAHLGDQLIC